MTNVRATFLVKFYGRLPEDEDASEVRFDEWEEDVLQVLNAYRFGNGIVSESFSVIDGETTPHEDD